MSEKNSIASMRNCLQNIRNSPKESGTIDFIVRRPDINQREIIEIAELDTDKGLIGDCWLTRAYKQGPPHPEMQINIMNARVIAAIEPNKERWPLAGDQLYIDFDISKENLPAGSRLTAGSATLEVTNEPHLGCKKFAERFGKDAVMFVNSDEGKALNLRGINAKVVVSGTVKPGDAITKL